MLDDIMKQVRRKIFRGILLVELLVIFILALQQCLTEAVNVQDRNEIPQLKVLLVFWDAACKKFFKDELMLVLEEFGQQIHISVEPFLGVKDEEVVHVTEINAATAMISLFLAFCHAFPSNLKDHPDVKLMRQLMDLKVNSMTEFGQKALSMQTDLLDLLMMTFQNTDDFTEERYAPLLENFGLEPFAFFDKRHAAIKSISEDLTEMPSAYIEFRDMLAIWNRNDGRTFKQFIEETIQGTPEEKARKKDVWMAAKGTGKKVTEV